jgi:hypothetical protein
MDFIEQLFGVSPDNGDGTTEVLWLVVLAILLAAGLYWKRRGAPMPWRNRSSLHSRLGLDVARGERARFTSTARTRVGDLDLVVVTSPIDAADAASLVGAIVEVDGARCAVHDATTPGGQPIRKGQPLMLKVRKLP